LGNVQVSNQLIICLCCYIQFQNKSIWVCPETIYGRKLCIVNIRSATTRWIMEKHFQTDIFSINNIFLKMLQLRLALGVLSIIYSHGQLKSACFFTWSAARK
jgi:hypothetical protein